MHLKFGFVGDILWTEKQSNLEVLIAAVVMKIVRQRQLNGSRHKKVRS